MLKTLKHSTLSFLGRIPVIRNFVPEKYNSISNTSTSSRARLATLHKEASRTSSNTNNGEINRSIIANYQEGQTKGKEAVTPILSIEKSPILDTMPDLKEKIVSHIKRRDLDLQAPVDFQEAVISTQALEHLNGLIVNYKTEFSLIQQRSSGSINPQEYVDLMQEFISKSINFALEINNQIIGRTATLDPYVQDYDIAKAFSVARNVSKKLANQAYIALCESFPALPHFRFDEAQGLHVANYIRSKLKDNIEALHFSSQFGLQAAELFQAFKDQISLKVLDSPAATLPVHNTLNLLEAFQEATHGSLLISTKEMNSNITVADLDKETKTKIINALIQTIIQEYTLRHDEISDEQQADLIRSMISTKQDIADCLIALDREENTTFKKVIELGQNKLWTDLFGKQELGGIKQLYAGLCSTDSLLGRTNKDVIMGHNHPAQPIRDHLTINPNSSRIDLERIIHEISLLAVMDTLTKFRGRKREHPVFESYANFQTIPWLKPLYEARCKEYASWIETEQVTKLPTRRLVKELARLGAELHSGSSESNPEFSFRDFAKRYKVEDLRNAMFKRVADLTDIDETALQLEFFSKLASYLKSGEQEGLTDFEVKRIKDLTEFLLEQTTIIGEDGKQIIAAKNNDPTCIKKHEDITKLIANRGTLIVNTPIVIKFLLNSLGLENGSTKAVKGKSIERENALLAAFLFYILLKYLPETSSSIDSLLKRTELVTTLIDNFTPLLEELPVLKSKILKHSLGFGETTKSGVIPSLCKDLEKHLNEYPQRIMSLKNIEQRIDVLEKEYLETHDRSINIEINRLREQVRQIRPITLSDLLIVHGQLSDCIQRNPIHTQQIQTLLSDAKQPNGLLLKDLRDYVGILIEVEPATIINFVKNSANQELQIYTKKLLIAQASKLAQELIASNSSSNGTIRIVDNDEVAIKKYSKMLNLIRYTAFLINHYGAKEVSINSAGIEERDQNLRGEIIQRINMVSELMKKNVMLLIDDNRFNEEVFPGQLEAKRALVEALQEFRIPSELGPKMEWTSQAKVQKMLEDRMYREQTIKFPGAKATEFQSRSSKAA